MITEQSNYYFRFPGEIENRLDFVHYHPDLDDLKHLDKITPFSVNKFGDTIKEKQIILYIASGSTPKGIDYLDSGIMFLGAGNIKEGRLDLTEVPHIKPSYHNGVLSSSRLKKKDILITMAGIIGRCCIFDINGEANINQAIAKVEINTDIVVPEYLLRYLNSKYGQKGFLKYRHDVSQPNINLQEIKMIKLIIPPKNVQEQIINTVRPTESEAINFELKMEESFERANKILLEELRIDLQDKENSYFFKEGRQNDSDYYYLFNEEIGKRFHYLFNHPKLEILEIFKSKFETVSLKNICREPIRCGEQPEYSDFGVMVIKTVDLKNCFIDYKNTLRVSEDFYESKLQAHIQKNDILISSTGYVSMGKIDIFNIDEAALADPQLLIVRLNKDYDINFITHYLRSPFGQVQFDKWFSGSSGQIHLYPEDVGSFIVPCKDSIPKEKQKEIAGQIIKEYQRAMDFEQKAQSKWQEAKELFENLILNKVKER